MAMQLVRTAPASRRLIATASVGAAVLHLLLVLPNHPSAMGLRAVAMLPLELPAVLGLLLLAGDRWRGWVATAVAGGLTVATLIKLADFSTFFALARPFNLLLDSHLLIAAWQLGVGAVGPGLTGLAVAAAVAVSAGIFLTALWAARAVAALGSVASARQPALMLTLGFALTWVSLDVVKRTTDVSTTTAAFTTRLVRDHIAFVWHSVNDLAEFDRAMAEDPFVDLPSDRLLTGLAGRDVLLIFVESYGRTTTDNPLYRETTLAALTALEEAVAARGLSARSAWLDSPVVGGQSWLAHATLLGGLTIDGQRRYESLLVSERETLIGLFDRAGWDTVAVMPAISMAWPEGLAFGYDRIYDSAGLEYRGLAFNWVTMPDQFTLSELARRELTDDPGRPPVFAEVAMISSHAPWTPIPPVLAWDAVGDGSVFDPYAISGDPPEVVWRDRARVRDQYRQSIDYVLRVLASFVAEKMAGDTVAIVVGDHQPAPLVTGQDAGLSVPIHVIADAETLSAIDEWSWGDGILPTQGAPTWPMAAFRDRFVAAFGAAQ